MIDQKKIEEIVSKKLAYCPEVKESDIYRVHRFRVEELKAELSTLIQEERKEAVEGFVKGFTEWLGRSRQKWLPPMLFKPYVEEYLESEGKK